MTHAEAHAAAFELVGFVTFERKVPDAVIGHLVNVAREIIAEHGVDVAHSVASICARELSRHEATP
jgi:hypothetical protein